MLSFWCSPKLRLHFGFPKSAPARFGCKQRKAHSNTGVGYGGAASTRSGGTPVRTVRAELARLSLIWVCDTAWSPLAEGPFFNGTLVPKIQLAILKTSKYMSWSRLAKPRDLVDSLVWCGDDRATEIFTLEYAWSLRSVPFLSSAAARDKIQGNREKNSGAKA